MSELLGWKVVVKSKSGKVLRVHRRLSAQEAQERADRATNCGNKFEMTPEFRRRIRRGEKYVNHHPKARRRAA